MDAAVLGHLGAAMKSRREALGLSQSELARRAGVAGQLVWRYEHGRAEPSLSLLAKVAEVLSVTIDDLLREAQAAAKKSTEAA